ncbi:hypothetical protein ACJX0J_028643, partial [Zea mays]
GCMLLVDVETVKACIRETRHTFQTANITPGGFPFLVVGIMTIAGENDGEAVLVIIAFSSVLSSIIQLIYINGHVRGSLYKDFLDILMLMLVGGLLLLVGDVNLIRRVHKGISLFFNMGGEHILTIMFLNILEEYRDLSLDSGSH